MIPVQHIAASQMFFLVEGMVDAARREGQPPVGIVSREFYKRVADETQGGVVDYVEGFNTVIDTLTACVLVALENEAMDFPGVFEYEVASAAGDWLYSNNCTAAGLSQDYKNLCLRIIEHAHAFFLQGESNPRDFRLFLFHAMRIRDALADGTYQFKAGVSR